MQDKLPARPLRVGKRSSYQPNGRKSPGPPSFVGKVVAQFEALHAKGALIDGKRIVDLITVNGVRVVTEDGTWGLVRASSNKPELVVVVESPVSEARMREMFKSVDAQLRLHPEVGAYNQTI